MVDLITDEQSVKSPSTFLKIENGAKVVLKSNLVRLYSHFTKGKGSVACGGDSCILCEKNKKKQEYYYFGSVNNDSGVIRIPPSCFFDMNEAEKLLGKDKRNYVWLISKTGSGQDTRYSTTRGDDVKPLLEKELKDNNEKLVKIMKGYQNTMDSKYEDIVLNSTVKE